MLSQEQLEYLFQYLEKPFYGNRFGFEDGIRLDTMNKVIYIKENAEKMDDLEWLRWYNENENNFPVIYSALTTFAVPKFIVHKIVDNLDAFDPVKKPSAGNSQKDSALLKFIVANDINDTYLQKIYDAMGMNFIFALSLDDEASTFEKPYINHISNKTMKFIVNKTLEDFSKHSHFSISSSRIVALLATKDEKFLKTIFKENEIDFHCEFDEKTAEELRTVLINNKHLSNKFKNELFAAGCNWMKLKYFTPEMAEEIYQSSVETYTDTYDKKTGVAKFNMSREYNNAQSMIDILLQYDALTEPMQYDLAQRIVSRESRRMDTYANELYAKTTSDRVLATAICLKSKTRESAYNNPHMPRGLIQERVEDMCKKMNNYIEKNKKEKIPEVWDDHISNGLYKTSIDTKYYDMLFWHQSFNTRMAIALSDFTPKEVKDEIYNFLTKVTDREKLPYGYQPRIKVSMEMMEFCDKENIDPNIKEYLREYFKKIGPFTTTCDFYEKTGISHYHLQQANFLLDKLVEDGNKDSTQTLLEFCRKSAGDCLTINKHETFPDQEKNIYKFLYLSLNQRIKDREEIEKYEETKDPKIFKSIDSLESYLINFKKDIIYDKSCSEYYMAIAQKGEEAYNLLMELEQREKEKEKEENFEK